MSSLPMTPSEIARGEAWNAETREMVARLDGEIAERNDYLDHVEAKYDGQVA